MHKVSVHVKEGAKIWLQGRVLNPVPSYLDEELDEISHWLRIHEDTGRQSALVLL